MRGRGERGERDERGFQTTGSGPDNRKWPRQQEVVQTTGSGPDNRKWSSCLCPHVSSDWVSEGTDYVQLALPRSCGGSHTVTGGNQRRSMKQHAQLEGDQGVQGVQVSRGVQVTGHPLIVSQCINNNCVCVCVEEEVDIVGLDGHIYRGRLNAPARDTDTKLPTISTKDGECIIINTDALCCC